LIARHPSISWAPGAQKETHFFDACWDVPVGEDDIALYHRYFPRHPDCKAGEWTPDYFYHAWIPRQIALSAPHVKILILLRDPFDRYKSGLRHWLMLGGERSNLGNVADMSLARSCYSSLVVRVMEYFPPEQILVLQHELCVRETEEQLRRTFEFLELPDVDFVPPDASRPRNSTPETLVIPGALTHDVHDALGQDLQLLKEAIPTLDLSLWPTANRGRLDE
jgi:hypothetical protein